MSGRTTRGGCGSNVIAIGGAAVLDGAALHALDDLEMSAMQAVEVAEREHRMHEPGRPRIVGKVQDLHAGYDASTMASSTRPSYASSTPAGRRALVCGVSQVVRHVREVGAPRRDPRNRRQRLVHGEVRRVLLVAQRVDDQRVDAFDERPRLVGNGAAVGQVGEARRSGSRGSACCRAAAAPARPRTPADVERPVDLVRLDLRNAAAQSRHAVEDVMRTSGGCSSQTSAVA